MPFQNKYLGLHGSLRIVGVQLGCLLGVGMSWYLVSDVCKIKDIATLHHVQWLHLEESSDGQTSLQGLLGHIFPGRMYSVADLDAVLCTVTPKQQHLQGSGSELGCHLPPFIPESPSGYSLGSWTEGLIILSHFSENLSLE